MRTKPLDHKGLVSACRVLCLDPVLGRVHELYGVPPLWDRPTGFGTLLQIILEQQVSLASAKACFDKLTVYLGEVTPTGLLELNDIELRTIGFSRQKAAYARHLSEALIGRHIDLAKLDTLSDADA